MSLNWAPTRRIRLRQLCLQDGMIVYTAFFPNILHSPGFLLNLFLSCGARGIAAEQVAGVTGEVDPFSISRSAWSNSFWERRGKLRRRACRNI